MLVVKKRVKRMFSQTNNQQRRILTMCFITNPQTLKHLEIPIVKATTGTFYRRN